jgi:hypothetical protein
MMVNYFKSILIILYTMNNWAKVNNPHRKKAVGKWSTNSLPTAYQQLTDSLPTAYQQLTDSLPTTREIYILDNQVRP